MKAKVKEIFIMRAFACASVVLLHSISIVQQLYRLTPISTKIFHALQLLLLYSTPLFVFISEFVLSYSYKTLLPNGFFKKRFKYILLPYIFFGIFYGIQWAYSYSVTDPAKVITQIFLYVFRGDYHGYFILIIFQYYLLHKLIGGLLNKWNKKILLLCSFVFNVLYLSFFNYTMWYDYATFPFSRYIWTRGYFMVFPAWIFYFILAYYGGQYIEHLTHYIHKYKWAIFPLTLFFACIILFQYKFQLLTTISTKRPDVVPYTLMIILWMYFIGSLFRTIPRSLDTINQSSYGIYLLHPFFQLVLQNVLLRTNPINNPYLGLITIFILSLYLPTVITRWANRWSHGHLFVGKLGPSGRDKESGPILLTTKYYLPIRKNILCLFHKISFKDQSPEAPTKK